MHNLYFGGIFVGIISQMNIKTIIYTVIILTAMGCRCAAIEHMTRVDEFDIMLNSYI